MRTISEQELKNILDKHGKWLRNEDGGVHADLSSADLSFADLRSANLRFADLRFADLSCTMLENKAIITFQFNRHTAHFLSDNTLQIGCHTHDLKTWLDGYVEIGKKEGYTEREIQEYGRFIKGCIKIQASMDENK